MWKIDKSDVKWHFMKRRTWSLRWCAFFPTFDIPPWRSANKSWQNGQNHQFLFFALFTTNSGRTTVDQIPSFGKDRPMCIGLHIIMWIYSCWQVDKCRNMISVYCNPTCTYISNMGKDGVRRRLPHPAIWFSIACYSSTLPNKRVGRARGRG